MTESSQDECRGGPKLGQQYLGALPGDWRASLDEEGVPLADPVGAWADGPSFPGNGPGELDPLASGWLRAVLRFTRPDGSPVFGPRRRSPDRLRTLAAWAGRVGDPGLATVMGWWLPGVPVGVVGASAPPPLPADARPDRPLAILRPDWTPRGDLVAVDHRSPGGSSLIEVAAKGQTWLGPTWSAPPGAGRVGRAVPASWTTGAFADGFEWTFKVGRRTITRTAVLLRGRSLALLGQQDDGDASPGEIRLSLPDGIGATPDPATRSLVLSSGRGRPSARLIPIGLPASPYPTDRGSLELEGSEVVLRQRGEGRRRWLALLVAWGKAPTAWRTLTVAARSQACRPAEAFAARVAWGPADEGLVVYRSLAPPALRNFLGHQTRARFLIGAFTAAGNVRPLLKVDA